MATITQRRLDALRTDYCRVKADRDALSHQRDRLREALNWIADKLRAEGQADRQDAFQIIHHIEATLAKAEGRPND